MNSFRIIADTYESIQDVRLRAENRLRAMLSGSDEYDPLRERIMEEMTMYKESEVRLRSQMTRELGNLPIWQEFLRHVNGIGSTLACKLLAFDLSPDKPLSSWNAYFALTPIYWKGICKNVDHKRLYSKDPLFCLVTEKKKDGTLSLCKEPILYKEKVSSAPRRIKGWKGFWNPRARVLAFIIGTSFLKFGKFYREQYLRFKERIQMRESDQRKVIVHLGAQRRMVQLFLAHFYQATLELSGRVPRIPYQFEYLNHSPSSFVHWREVIRYEGRDK